MSTNDMSESTGTSTSKNQTNSLSTQMPSEPRKVAVMRMST